MLTSGDVCHADLGEPSGREAGFPRPVVVVTAQSVLSQSPSVVYVVPLTTTMRAFRSEIEITPDESNGLVEISAAQCQHLREVSTGRLGERIGNVGPEILMQIRETILDLLDI